MKKLLIAAFIALVASPNLWAQQAESYVAGRRVASQYAYGYGQVPGAHVAVGNSSTGAQTVTVCPAVRALPDGRVINLFQSGTLNPVTFDLGTAASETVTPTTVSIVSPGGLTVEADQNCAAITATFSFTHAPSQFTGQVRSGTVGLQEAINDAAPNGGLVTVDNSWSGTNAILQAAIPFPNVAVEDLRSASPAYWNVAPTTASFLAVPATLTATTVGFGLNGANTTSGTYTGTSTYHVCVSYVDIAGNEGPCSLDFSGLTAGTGSTNQIGVAAPAASTGAVGYTLYISLASGSYALAYQVPLTSSVCKLTLVETITPACVVVNSNYNQTAGSNAIVSALTVNTSPLALQLGAASTTADYVGNSNSHTTYGYVQGTKLALGGIISAVYTPITAIATAATTVPADLVAVPIPAGFMNQLGKTIRVCGKATITGNATSDTVQRIQLLWDGAGSDTTGAPVIVGNIQAGAASDTAAAWTVNFCETLSATVVGAGATAGSINTGESSYLSYLASAPATPWFIGGETSQAAIGSLNLAGGSGFTSRLHVVYLHAGGTDTAMQLLHLTIEAL
jgi:hypothetical protein